MQSRWSESAAAESVDRYAGRWGEDLALRVYTSRLIGADPSLVLHGGGNTSLKGSVTTLVGEVKHALFVKGSGWDLDSIEPEGLPAVDLAHLRKLRDLERLDDRDMVNELRTHLFDASAPNPSVETLLHAFLPHRYVDHTHADIALVVTNQPEGTQEELVRAAFGPRWAIVPYEMPGHALAKLSAAVFEGDPTVEGLVLLNHGLFTFADDARTSYERMIEAVDRAERFVRERRKAAGRTAVSVAGASPRSRPAPEDGAARLSPFLRGALALATGDADRPWRRMVLEHRAPGGVLDALARPEAAELAAANPLTPDHVIRTKGTHLFLDALPVLDDDTALRRRVVEAVGDFARRYGAYFETHRHRSATALTALDPHPRVVLVPGVGIIAAGATKSDARIAADIAEHTVVAKAAAGEIGRYEGLSDARLFDLEYWSLEQAKLANAPNPLLGGQVALVSGGAGAIGAGIARRLLAAGAHVVLADIDLARATDLAVDLDPKGRGVATAVGVDVTDEASVDQAFATVCRTYGGVDIAVPNAGIATVGSLEHLDVAEFRRVVDVNLVGCVTVMRAAARVMTRQGTGGNIVVISSKNVFAPGAEFSAYSASKAAGHQLGRVAALELAGAGIRVNMVNPDAVFGDAHRPSGLWQAVGPARAASRGIDAGELAAFYQQRNLLKAKITPEHVGNAVVFFASNQTPTTGAALPVDGGVPDAFPR